MLSIKVFLYKSTTIIALTIIALATVRGIIFADLEDPGYTLGSGAKGIEVKKGMDASGKTLYGSSFVGLDLENANFDESHLGGVRFHDCILKNASFRGAILTGCTLTELRNTSGEIETADFTDAVINGINPNKNDPSFFFTPEQLKVTKSYKAKQLWDCNISAGNGCALDFTSANLRGANLAGDLRKCIFTHAFFGNGGKIMGIIRADQLSSFAAIPSTISYWCAFEGNPDFSGVNLEGTAFGTGINKNAVFMDSLIAYCKFQHTFTKEQLYSTKSYKDGNLIGISFQGINFSDGNFKMQNLSMCQFLRCNLSNAIFDGAIITGVKINNSSQGLSVPQIKSTWNYKHGRMEGIVLPREIAEALRKESKSTQEEKESSD